MHIFIKRTALKSIDNKQHIKTRYDYCQLKLSYHDLVTYQYTNNLHNVGT